MTELMPPEVRTVPFRLYRFYDESGVLLYVGQTGRYPWKRLLEHVCEQPWADEMARWEVDPGAWETEADVLAAELAAIRAERPRFNVQGNESNPLRVDPRTMRWANGRPYKPERYARRMTPTLPVQRQSQRKPTAASKPTVTPAERALKHPLTWWAVTWVTVSGGLWWGLVWVMAEAGRVLPAEWGAGLSAIGAVVVLVWARREARRLRRRWKRMWR